ncbi:MAG: tandem-95 repeat protein, partial [Fluviicola sp.]|nr:tandem-95 repeat protein [Fluviicola sp.]
MNLLQKLTKLMLFVFSLIAFVFQSYAQCNTSNFTVQSVQGSCFSNAEIKVTVPASTGCYGWVAEITKTGGTPVAQNIPTIGGVVTFSSLQAGQYNVVLSNGFTTLTYSGNPVSVATTYTNMVVNISNLPPTCSSNSSNYSPDGTITINVPSGGIGPFVYKVVSQYGTQIDTLPARTKTFGNMGNGETVNVAVTDLVNGSAGCEVVKTQIPVLSANTSAILTYGDRAYNLIRDCSVDCNSYKLYINLRNLSTTRLNNILIPGNAIITINSVNYPLTYIPAQNRFTYDPVAVGGPALTNNLSVTTRFDWGCGILTRTSNISMPTNYLNAYVTNLPDNANCTTKYRFTIIGDQDYLSGGYYDRNVYYCAPNSVVFERRISTSPDVFDTVPGNLITPNPYATTSDLNIVTGGTYPSANTSFTIETAGYYRVTVKDDCNSVTRFFNVTPTNPIEATTVVGGQGVLEGTSGLVVTVTSSGINANPTVEISRIDNQSSITISPSQPLTLAGSYTINFPIIKTISPTGSSQQSFIDLPLGQYKVIVRDACTSITGAKKEVTINLNNPANYNPSFQVVNGCANSNKLHYNMNPNANAMTGTSSLANLYNVTSNGSIGSLVQSGGYSGVFHNLSSGNYMLKFQNIGSGNWSGYRYSVARNSAATWEYQKPITIDAYQDFTFDISTSYCDITDTTSGLIAAQLAGGTIIYPTTFSLYKTNNAVTPVQGPITLNSPQTNVLFTNVTNGNYFIRATNNCYSVDQNVQLSGNISVPTAEVDNAFVCPNEPAAIAIISATTNLYDITWKNALGQVVGNGMPVSLAPAQTETFTATFTLNSSLGCANTQVYSSDVLVNVTPNPDSLLTVSDIDLCDNLIFEVKLDSSQINFDYELLNSNKQSLSPPYIIHGNGFPLTFTIPTNITLNAGDVFYVSSTNGNEGCAAILEDSCLVFQSTADSTLNVNGDAICLGEDGTIEIENSEIGVNYTVFKNNQPVTPVLSAFGDGNSINFTIPSSLLVSGINSFSIQATDTGCANVFLTQKGIIAVDTVNPVFISCPSNSQVFVVSGTCANTATWTLPTASDNCALDTIIGSHAPGSTFQLGATVVTYVAYDEVGNTDTCSFVVTVVDNIAPVFTSCPQNIIKTIAQTNSSANVILPSPVATDNCQVDTFVLSHVSNALFPLGNTTVSYLVFDAAGNSDTCTFVVTVVRNDSPIALNDSISLNEDSQATIVVVTNDTDQIGGIDIASVSIISNPSNGTASVGSNGQITYIPALNFNGIDSLLYTICDLASPTYCDTATVYFRVLPVNDAPIVDDENITTNEDTPATGDLTDAGDFDPDGTTLTANTTPVDAPNHGTIVINTDGTYTYTPTANFNGTDTVVVSICDSGLPLPASCVNDTIFITVNAVNDAPLVDDENITTNEDTAASGDLTDAGDSDPDGTTLTANTTPVDAPNHGTIVINPNGTYTYTPAANFNGTDTVVVSICDSGLPMPAICANDTIFITVNPVNDAPIVDDENITTNEDTPATGDLTNAGDSDPEGTTLTVNTTPVVAPNHGTIVINTDGTFTYTPTTNFNGRDTVVVSICDNGLPLPALCSNATIFITVNLINDAPIANNDSAITNEDTPLAINVLSNDVDNDGLIVSSSVTVTTAPSNGSTSVNPISGAITYTPNANFIGTDVFTYQVCDNGPAVLCDFATVMITIKPKKDTITVTTSEETPNTICTSSFTNFGSYPVVAVSICDAPNNGVITSAVGTSCFTYTPASNFSGNDTICVISCGANGLCDTSIVVIVVNPINDTPIVDNEIITTNEDTAVSGDLTNAGDSDPEGTTLTANTTPVDAPNHGTIIINPNGTYTYTPTVNFNGTDTVVVSICDNGLPLPAICANDTIFITVNPVNDAPIVDNEIITTNEDTAATGDLTNAGDSDPDGTTLTANTTPVDGPNHGTIVINPNGTFTYTPTANYNGTDTVVVSICDGGLPLPASCVNDTIFITVSKTNDAPNAVNDNVSTNEDTPVAISVISNDVDLDGILNPSTVHVVSTPTHGFTSVNSITGEITYTPNTDFIGTDNFTYQVCDNGSPVMCATATVFVTIKPVKDTSTISTPEETPITICTNTLTNFGASPIVSISLCNPPNNGVLTPAFGTSCFTYTPANNFIGNDTICVISCALNGLCDTSVIVISVNPINDAPIANNDSAVTNEDTPLAINVLSNDVDNDGLIVSTTVTVTTAPSYGSTSVNPTTGAITYTPNTNFIGTDVFTYQVCDNGPAVLCDFATVTVTVKPKKDTITVTTSEETPNTICTNTFTNFGSYPVVAISICDAPNNGVITPAVGTSCFTYTPASNFSGNDTICVISCGANGLCDTSIVVIVVNPINDAPLVDDEIITTNEDTPATGDLTNAGDFDPDGTTLTANTTPVDGPNHGGIVINIDGTYTYTPTANFNGTDTVVVSICDSGLPMPAI